MRFGIISDIHANLVAFDTVLSEMDGIDQYWCLGDIVGYGPQPNECVERLLELDHVAILGNHDAAAIGKASTRAFNGEARRAIEWTGRQLTKENGKYLKSLPETMEHDQVLLVHGSPRDPIWEYITTVEQAAEAFADTSAPYILIGHTHIPMVYVRDSHGKIYDGVPETNTSLRLGNERILINPGSVGQPRDGDPRAAYAVIDSDKLMVEFHRVEYDIERVQKVMRKVGASEWLASRLSYGR